MSDLRRLAAMLVCIILLCGCLSSCITSTPDNTDKNNGQDSTDTLPSDKYLATVRVEYLSEDEKLRDAIGAIGTPTTTVEVDGDNIKLLTIASTDDISITKEYVYIDGIVYHGKNVVVADMRVTTLERATMSADDKASLISKAGPGASIETKDFLNINRSSADGITTYSCTEIKAESKESLRKILSSSFSGLDATVRIADVSFRLDKKDGRNHSSLLSCKLTVTMDDVDYDLTMNLYYDYDYDAQLDICVPQDNDRYTEVSIDEILG